MLKKLLKGCLTVTMVAALAIPAMAESKVNGRAKFEFYQNSVKDGASTMDMTVTARLGGTATGEAGSYKATGFLNTDISEGGVSLRDVYVSLADDAMTIQMGRWNPWGVYNLPIYGEFVETSFPRFTGENLNSARTTYVKVGLNSVKLDLILGMNLYDTVDATDDQYSETTFGVKWKGDFGAIGVQAEYASQSRAIDAEYGDATKGNANDGATLSLIAFSVKYSLSDAMNVGLNYESVSSKAGNADDAKTDATTELVFNMNLGDGLGLSAYYYTEAIKEGDAKTDKTRMGVTTLKGMGLVKLYAGYRADTSKTDTTDGGSSKLSVGAKVDF